MSHLAGRQAEGNVMRNEYGVLGGFEETGREEVKKDVSKIAAKADKPDFFMGGCGPTVPTGPKRKLRNSWMSKSPAEDAAPPRVEHVPKPLKKWTPVKKKALPPRSKTHDGSVNPLATRGGKKSSPFGGAKKKEEPDDKPKEKEAEPKKQEEKAPQKEEEPPQKRSVSPLSSSAPASSAPAVEEVMAKPATPPPKAAAPKESPKPKEAEKPAVETPAQSPASGDAKDVEIAALKAEIEKLKQEKGSLARDLKKSKGAAGMNKELKEEIFELKQQLKKAGTKDENAKGFHKLENKLNTLKMILDGKVNKNNLEDLQEHVSMVNMIINQDLRKEGMKNVWA